jgi:hypothetical protein
MFYFFIHLKVKFYIQYCKNEIDKKSLKVQYVNHWNEDVTLACVDNFRETQSIMKS